MADREHILFDKTEIVVFFQEGNNAQLVNLKYNDIKSITLDIHEEKKLFSTKRTEKMSINNSKTPQPITLYQSKEKHWDEYKAGIRKFAHDHRITILDSLPDAPQA